MNPPEVEPGGLRAGSCVLWDRMINSICVIRSWSRYERILSAAITISMTVWAIYFGVISTSLLDLECLTSSSTYQIGIMLTVGNLAGIVGAAVGGQLLAGFNNLGVLACVCCFHGCTIILQPWARSFPVLITFSAINGLFAGVADTGFNVSALLLWGWRSFVYMQSFHAAYALGTFLGTFLAKPFLAPAFGAIAENMTSWIPAEVNTTMTTLFLNTTGIYDRNIPFRNVGESRVMYPFMISGVALILCGISFIFMYITFNKNLGEIATKETQPKGTESEDSRRKICPNLRKGWYDIPMTVMTAMRFAAYSGLEMIYSRFVMTYAVKGLNFEKSDSVMTTTAFMGSFAAFRVIGIFMAMCISPTIFVLIDVAFIVLAHSIMVSMSMSQSGVLVLTSALSGMGQATFYGCSMSWASKYINLTERKGSVFTTSSWVGTLALPILTGYLMEHVTVHAFLYIGLADALFLGVVTVISTVFGLIHGRVAKVDYDLVDHELSSMAQRT